MRGSLLAIGLSEACVADYLGTANGTQREATMSDDQTTERDEEQDEGRDEKEAQEGSGADDGEEARSSGDQGDDSGDSSASSDSEDDDGDGDGDGDKSDKKKQDEEIEAAKEEVKGLEGDPPEDLEDWPRGKALYETFGGPEGDHGYHEGAEEDLGPSSLRHHEDGTVTVEGEEVDDPDEYKGKPIPGGPTDPDTANLRSDKASPDDSSQNEEGEDDSDSGDDDEDSGDESKDDD
jgi:hypothetical protein